jgi:hypothetical protein
MTFHRRTALIYGDSLFLEGISASLRARGDLSVLSLKPPTDPATLKKLAPDLVLVDASQFTPSQAEDLSSTFAGDHSPPVIRLDLDKQHLTVVSTQQFPAASLEDLEQALEIISKPM